MMMINYKSEKKNVEHRISRVRPRSASLAHATGFDNAKLICEVVLNVTKVLRVIIEDGNKMIHHFVASSCRE